MKWFDPGDRSEPVLEPRKQIESKYPGMKVPVLPPRAVVFCLGRGMPVTKEMTPLWRNAKRLSGNTAGTSGRPTPGARRSGSLWKTGSRRGNRSPSAGKSGNGKRITENKKDLYHYYDKRPAAFGAAGYFFDCQSKKCLTGNTDWYMIKTDRWSKRRKAV